MLKKMPSVASKIEKKCEKKKRKRKKGGSELITQICI